MATLRRVARTHARAHPDEPSLAHGGRIWLEDAPCGTRVRFSLQQAGPPEPANEPLDATDGRLSPVS